MKVTIKEVAKEAGVSVATVSRVLNKTAIVSDSVSENVKNAVKKLNYTPNFMGRNLRKCETNLILAIIPSTELSYYGEIIRGMQDKAKNMGYTVILNISPSPYEAESKLNQMLANRIVDAAVLLSTQLSAERINEISEKYPLALCCESVEGAKVLTVTVDDVKGGYSAVTELIKKGHKKIGIVASTDTSSSSRDRFAGYRMALEENGLSFDKKYVFEYTYRNIYDNKILDYFMSLKEPPTAIFAFSDLVAISILKDAIEKNIIVGRDIDVIGYDNIMISKLYSPSLSTVAQPSYDIGQVVIEKLIYNINSDEKCTDRILLPCSVILRESTGHK